MRAAVWKRPYPIRVTLYAASSARDTDFIAKLDGVYPDGTSMLIELGIQRARYRESETHPTLVVQVSSTPASCSAQSKTTR
jgi:predicted acyl esterase